MPSLFTVKTLKLRWFRLFLLFMHICDSVKAANAELALRLGEVGAICLA
jgi:hypothetical protein